MHKAQLADSVDAVILVNWKLMSPPSDTAHTAKCFLVVLTPKTYWSSIVRSWVDTLILPSEQSHLCHIAVPACIPFKYGVWLAFVPWDLSHHIVRSFIWIGFPLVLSFESELSNPPRETLSENKIWIFSPKTNCLISFFPQQIGVPEWIWKDCPPFHQGYKSSIQTERNQ